MTIRITKVLRAYRVRYLNTYRKKLEAEMSDKEKKNKLEGLVLDKEKHIKEFVDSFIKDEHMNIMLIDRGNYRWYTKGLIHAAAMYVAFIIISSIIKALF